MKCAAAAAIFRRTICGCISAWAARSKPDLEIHWPSGQVDRIGGVKCNQAVTVKEGEAVARISPPK